MTARTVGDFLAGLDTDRPSYPGRTFPPLTLPVRCDELTDAQREAVRTSRLFKKWSDQT